MGMDDLREYAEYLLKNKEARKIIPVLKIFTTSPVMLSLITGLECACAEFDKLCPTGDC